MKNLLIIAMALVSVSAFAEHHEKDAHKAAAEACAKDHGKDKKALEACVAEKLKAAPAPEAAAPAPAKK